LSPRVETRLNQSDVNRLDEAAKTTGKNRSKMARQALLWFLDNQDNMKNDERETEVAQAMRYATGQHVKAIKNSADRICKMLLAKQSTALGTLYSLWLATKGGQKSRSKCLLPYKLKGYAQNSVVRAY